MSKTASVLDTGTSGSTPVGYHDLPWPSAASGTPGLLEPASASITGRSPVADFRQKGILVRILLPRRSIHLRNTTADRSDGNSCLPVRLELLLRHFSELLPLRDRDVLQLHLINNRAPCFVDRTFRHGWGMSSCFSRQQAAGLICRCSAS